MSSAAYAAAQERVLQRQTEREAEVVAHRLAHDEALRSSSLSRFPFPLRQCAPLGLSFWSTIQNREGTRPAFRVGQVDAELLDAELLELLRTQVGDALKYFGPHILDDWSQEILLGLRAALFKLSIWDNDASYGASLQNLKYTDARSGELSPSKPAAWQKTLYGFITIFGRYGWDRWESWLVDVEGGFNTPSVAVQRLSRLTSWASTTHSIAAFLSFLVFLVNGRYRTLTDRLLRLRLVSPVSQVSREVSFEYLNRQLVWHAFTEFLLFLLPLVGISRWRRWLSRAWKRTKSALESGEHDDDQFGATTSGPLAFLPERTCAICYQDQTPATTDGEILGTNLIAGGIIGSATTDVVNPYQTLPCQCLYCFVCIATRLEAEEGGEWSCLRCGMLVHQCKPWSGDVVVEKRHKGVRNDKAVGFVQNIDGESALEPLEQKAPASEDRLLGESTQWTDIDDGGSSPPQSR